jgi:hypothetical protein
MEGYKSQKSFQTLKTTNIISKKLFHGSCHCGKIKYLANIDLAQGSGKCNCTFYLKNCFWSYKATTEDFEWTAGQDSSTKYSSNPMIGEYVFCKICGTMPFGVTKDSEWTKAGASIRLVTLDDISIAELSSIPVTYTNGRDDSWTTITDPEIIKTMY